MKEDIIFKVVSKIDNNLVSVITKKHALLYAPNRWTNPKIGKIFAFETWQEANSFIDSCIRWVKEPHQLWKAIGKNPTRIDIVCSGFYSITDFWNKRSTSITSHKPSVIIAPKGTIIVDSLKLLERLPIKDLL